MLTYVQQRAKFVCLSIRIIVRTGFEGVLLCSQGRSEQVPEWICVWLAGSVLSEYGSRRGPLRP